MLCFWELSSPFPHSTPQTPGYFWSSVDWIHECRTCGYGGLTGDCSQSCVTHNKISKDVAITCSSSSSPLEQESGFSPAETIHFLGSACLHTMPSRWPSLSSFRKSGRWKSLLLKCTRQAGGVFPFLTNRSDGLHHSVQQSPAFLAAGTSFTEHNFFHRSGSGGWF